MLPKEAQGMLEAGRLSSWKAIAIATARLVDESTIDTNKVAYSTKVTFNQSWQKEESNLPDCNQKKRPI